jgi:hypothetical protein
MAMTVSNGDLPITTNADDTELTAVVASAREHILSAILELSEVSRPMQRAAYYAQFLELARAWKTCRQPPARTQFVQRLTSRLLAEIDPTVRELIRRAIRLLQVDSPQRPTSDYVLLCQVLILKKQ